MHRAFSKTKAVRVLGEAKAQAYWEELFRGLAPRDTKFPKWIAQWADDYPTQDGIVNARHCLFYAIQFLETGIRRLTAVERVIAGRDRQYDDG